MDMHRILIQEASLKEDFEVFITEENNGIANQGNNKETKLKSGSIGTNPAQLIETQSSSASNIQSDLEHSVMLVTENEDDSGHPPSKKLKTEQKMQDAEMIANRIEDHVVDTQVGKESESKINEEDSQPSGTGFLLRTTDLLPEDKNKNDENADSEVTVTSSDVHLNRIDCFVTDEKTNINESEEKSENKTVMKSSEEHSFMDQPLETLNDQETHHLSKEILINVTKTPGCNISVVENPQKESIIVEYQNKKPQNQETKLSGEYHGENNGFSPGKETNQSDIEVGSERNETASDETSTGNYVKEISCLLVEDKKQIVEIEPNTKAESDTEVGSERNETASDETSTGNYVKEISCLLVEDKKQIVEIEPNTKAESCEEFISNDTTSDNQQNPKHEGNNQTSSEVTVTTNEVDCEENQCVLPAEKVNGEEVVDTAAETNILKIIFEHRTSWTAMKDEVFKLVDIPCDSDKGTEIKTLFHSTTQKHFKLTKIVEVQNPFLYGCYLLKKAELMSRYGHVKEEYLFHGTKVQNISSIGENNLDWRKHGSVTGNIFGKGVSLTPISCYASHYSDDDLEEKIMFACKVLIANETEGNPDMVLPPYKDSFNKLRYDTTIRPNRKVVVKFSDNEFYPEYLLYYTGEYRRRCYLF